MHKKLAYMVLIVAIRLVLAVIFSSFIRRQSELNSLPLQRFMTIEQGKYEQDIGYFNKVLAIDPNNLYALDSKGIAKAEEKRT